MAQVVARMAAELAGPEDHRATAAVSPVAMLRRRRSPLEDPCMRSSCRR
jgi:hypothetical protein